MKTSKPSMRFWTLLAVVNGAAILYPVHLVLQGGSTMESFLATVVLVFVVFLLAVVDVISIVAAYSLGGPRPKKRHTPARPIARVIPLPTQRQSHASNL